MILPAGCIIVPVQKVQELHMETGSKTKRPSKPKKISFILFLLAGMAVSSIAGYLAGRLSARSDSNLMLPAMLAFAFVCIYIHLILHEGGHLLFGLLGGYTFSSFRIGSRVIKKENGKFKTARMHLAGTAGQCLMDPPAPKNGTIPVILYNMGGVLLNLLVSLVCLLLAFSLHTSVWIQNFLLIAAMAGICLAFMNGFPISTSTVSNDGYNTWMLSRNKEANQAFYTVMKCNHLSSQGVRLKDMPADLLVLPDESHWNNQMVSSAAVLCENRYMDARQYEKAQALAESLLEKANLTGIYEQLLKGDLLSLALLNDDHPKAKQLYTKELKRFFKQFKNLPTAVRMEYIAVLLEDKDFEKAEKIKARFDSLAKTYPYPAELFSERALMNAALQKAGQADLDASAA